MLKSVVPEVLDMAGDFIDYFALLDAYVDDANFFKKIQDDILVIAECLAWIDGDSSDYNGQELVKIFFGERYKNKKKEFLSKKAK